MKTLIQDVKFIQMVKPQAIFDDATATSTAVDISGYGKCAIVVLTGATDIAMTALKVQESDALSSATALSSGADITGLVYGTSLNPDTGATSTLPTSTTDGSIFAFEFDTLGRKRYVNLVATMGDGTAGGYFAAFAILGNSENGLYTAVLRGLAQNLIA